MKKKLEAELISIAHRILKLKNKSELIQLHQETQKLYEKLSVLRFVEENFGDIKPTIGQAEIEAKLETAFEAIPEVEEENAEESVTESESPEEVAAQTTVEDIIEEQNGPAETQEAISEEAPEEIVAEIPEEEAPEDQPEETPEIPEEELEKTLVSEDKPAETANDFFKPAFELSFDPKAEDTEEEANDEVKEDAKEEFRNANAQITFEDILGSSYVDPVFVKPEDLEREKEIAKPDNVIPIGRNFDTSPVISIHKTDEPRSYSLNDRLSKGITIGLNDRVAFMKHLFNNSSEDFNRVLSQLITFDTYDEAKKFIDTMVKPDYNNWEGKDEYADRFLEIVEKKFS